MRAKYAVILAVVLLLTSAPLARDVSVSSVTLTNLSAPTLNITYTLSRTTPTISASQPIWIFIKYSHDFGSTWMDTDDLSLANDWGAGGQTGASTVNQNLSGDKDIVTSAGSKSITWTWAGSGTGLSSTDSVRVRVCAVEMCQIDANSSFEMGGDGGADAITSGTANVAAFHIMKYPVTNRMWVDFLNELANAHDDTSDGDHDYWNSTQSHSTRGGTDISGSIPNATWSVTSGRDDWLVIGINWLNAYDMSHWMGLEIANEEQWELACRSVGGSGGNTYSWGDNPVPSTDNCNMSGTFSPGRPSDVNDFEDTWADSGYANPYGVFEMTGNVWEWNDTEAYTGAYNSAMSVLDYWSPPTDVINRGGSWGTFGTYLFGSARQVITPHKTHQTYIGFRGVKN